MRMARNSIGLLACKSKAETPRGTTTNGNDADIRRYLLTRDSAAFDESKCCTSSSKMGASSIFEGRAEPAGTWLTSSRSLKLWIERSSCRYWRSASDDSLSFSLWHWVGSDSNETTGSQLPGAFKSGRASTGVTVGSDRESGALTSFATRPSIFCSTCAIRLGNSVKVKSGTLVVLTKAREVCEIVWAHQPRHILYQPKNIYKRVSITVHISEEGCVRNSWQQPSAPLASLGLSTRQTSRFEIPAALARLRRSCNARSRRGWPLCHFHLMR